MVLAALLAVPLQASWQNLGLDTALNKAVGGEIKQEFLKVDLDNHFRTANYNKIVPTVDATWFLGKIKAIKNYDKVAAELTELNNQVKNEIEIFTDKYVAPGAKPGARALKMQVMVFDFRSGNGAASKFMGAGAGSGYCTYMVRFWDNGAEVARIENTTPILRSEADPNGDYSRKNIPQAVVTCIRSFLGSH